MTDLEGKLMRVLHFGLEDLETNRKGNLSLNQRRRLWRRQLRLVLWSISCTTITLFCFVYLITHFSVLWASPTRAFSGGVTCCIFGLVCTVFLIIRWWRVYIDLRTGYIGRINGPIRLDIREQEKHRTDYARTNYPVLRINHMLYINGFEFEISGRLYRYLDDQNSCINYVAYYLPHSHILVSLECLKHSQ